MGPLRSLQSGDSSPGTEIQEHLLKECEVEKTEHMRLVEEQLGVKVPMVNPLARKGIESNLDVQDVELDFSPLNGGKDVHGAGVRTKCSNERNGEVPVWDKTTSPDRHSAGKSSCCPFRFSFY